MTSSWVQTLMHPKKNIIAKLHKEAIAKHLRQCGLRFEDLYDEKDNIHFKEALRRLPREVVDARNQRIQRALDLSMKHECLPHDLQARQTPFRSYMRDMLALINRENDEREALGALPIHQREIP